MTLEDYEKARDIITQIHRLDDDIAELRDITRNNTSTWRLEVRASTACPSHSINHYGMLPEFIQVILSKHLEKRNELVKELEKI
jgi:hypothetical protein